MKKYTKILAIVLAALMLISAATLTGCAKKNTVLKVATNAEFEPFETLDSNNNVVGFDADLIKLIAEKMGMTVEISNMEFDGILAAVTSNTSDVGIAGLTIDAKRSKSVNFSDPYYDNASQILIVRSNDTTYTGKTKAELDNQLKGKTIGVCITYTGEAYAKGDEDWGFPGIEGANVKVYDTPSLAVADLKNGTISTIIMDDKVAVEIAATAENKDTIKTINVPLTVESYGIAVNKTNTVLLSKINKALSELKESGKLDELKQTWGI